MRKPSLSFEELAAQYAAVKTWPDLASREGLVFQIPPSLTYIGSLFPPIAVQPDAEQYQARRKSLIPFSELERKRADKELYERVGAMAHVIKSPRGRAQRICETIVEANNFIDDTDSKIAKLTLYDVANSGYQSPDTLRSDGEALNVLTDAIEAVEAMTLGFNFYKDGEEEEQETRRQEIKQYFLDMDNRDLLANCQWVIETLKSRRDFWSIELATVLTHSSIVELDRAIGEYSEVKPVIEESI